MGRDLSIESVLADPMIRAMMRADHVEPQAFERLLRSAAGGVEAGSARVAAGRFGAASLVASQACAALRGVCCA
ncbi:hypothetical protein P7D22_03380 [Lichenihabitans sp. Uapishka_5]|uniref:hypothetical protein n=1 Tax=Lichenihabitans sp. Uapishka_5 TaxID=3037302 RepID=UPI0029E8012C|nr:hypothetical protein [Lichenihabitans sp. Uapishka_5]MDX7950220.1 hypothetical protein [Lichenihabitans sp. Uapishka_5]